MLNYAGFALEPSVLTPTWPSAAPSQIVQLLPFTSLDLHQGVSKQFVQTSDPAVSGFSDADVLALLPGASGSMPLRYGGLEALLVCALGLEARRLGGDVFPKALAPGVWLHRFEIDPLLSAMAPWDLARDGIDAGDLTALTQRKVRRGTLAAQRDDVGVWELLSCMMSQLSLAWHPEGCTCSVEMVAYSTNTSPTVNTPTTLAQAAWNVSPNVGFREMRIRLAPYSATVPLNSTHELAVSSASFTLQNPFEVEPSSRTGLFAEEIERSGPPLVQGSLSQPRYLSNALVNAWPSNVAYSLDIRGTGPVIAAGYRWAFNVYFPSVRVTQADPSGLSHGRSSLPVNFYATTPPAPAAGMPVVSKPGPLILECITDEPLHTLLGV